MKSLRMLSHWLVYVLIRTFICIVQSTSLETCQWISEQLAWLAADWIGIRRRVVDDNLRHVYPDLDARGRRRLERSMWEHLFLMVCEVAHAGRRLHVSNFHRHIEFRGKRELVRRLLEPRPLLLVTGHFGNFELAGFITGLLGFPTYTISRPLDNPFLDAYIHAFRSSQGQFFLPKHGSATQADEVLKSNGILSLLGDQYAGPKGCWVEFLGRPTSSHKALGLFSLTGNAPMLVAYARRQHGRPLHFEIVCEGVADPQDDGPETANVQTLTQWYNDCLARGVRQTPDQYWWLHRRWREPPPRRRRRKAA